MKIGILTQTLHNNYGGLLQNYALQQVLIRAGHEPCTMDHTRTVQIGKARKMYRRAKAHLKHLLFPHKYRRPAYVTNEYVESVIARNTCQFIDKYIFRTKTFNTHEEFVEVAKANKYQAYVVGSDQCWRPRYNKSFLGEMFLNFAERQPNVKRIAYAASFGMDEWDLSQERIDEYARLAQKFDLITVREDSGVDLCRKHLGVLAHHVLDPTMLLSKDDYIRIVEMEKEPQSPGDLFYYILDPSEEKIEFVKNSAMRLGLVPFTVMPKHPHGHRTKNDIINHIEDCVYPSVTSWLRAFIDAKMVIVDSFHGMVFSIIFNKPFWAVGNERRGSSRFNSLLKMFDLEDRMIKIDQLDNWDIEKPIDWNQINQKRDRLSGVSMSLLYGVLNDFRR